MKFYFVVSCPALDTAYSKTNIYSAFGRWIFSFSALLLQPQLPHAGSLWSFLRMPIAVKNCTGSVTFETELFWAIFWAMFCPSAENLVPVSQNRLSLSVSFVPYSMYGTYENLRLKTFCDTGTGCSSVIFPRPFQDSCGPTLLPL